MHPLHDYVAGQVADRLKSRRVVVWYDRGGHFRPFIDELRGGPSAGAAPVSVELAGLPAHLFEDAGSLLELRVQVEPHVAQDLPDPVLVYLPGRERDPRGSIMLELEKAGETYEPGLKRLARNVLKRRYTDGVIDEMLRPDAVTWHDLARAASDDASAEPPSLLKGIFHDARGPEGLLALWLADGTRDADIAAKDATAELAKLARARLGLELPAGEPLSKLRNIAARYVLAAEFRGDLAGEAPSTLASVPAPATRDHEKGVRDLAAQLRAAHADAYELLADGVEAQLALATAKVPPERLGSIDTFRFEERALLDHCAALVAGGRFDDALRVVAERKDSFWLTRDPARKEQWEACRRMAVLGRCAAEVRDQVAKMDGGPDAWIARYTAKDGWYRLDQAQRQLEAVSTLVEDDASERALGLVRRAYEDTCHAMARGFARALEVAGWSTTRSAHQSRIYADVVAAQPRPVAYFLVDAMRYEMGVELAEKLPRTAEVAVRPAVAALPSITVVGMAALQPGAASSFGVVDPAGKLGARIDDAFLPDVAARQKHAAARVPQLVDLTLDELLGLSSAKLKKRVEGASVVVVRSQEIDHAGEAGFGAQARRVMDTVIDNLAHALGKLARAGVAHAVLSADHGHLFATERDESMRIDAPGGQKVELHRRCWIGRGGATPPGCVRVSAAALGYASDLDFVFPVGAGVFKAGGDLAFHHGGPSLQELIVPVITVRTKAPVARAATPTQLTVTSTPAEVTNRIFTAVLQLGGANLSLFETPIRVRPLLVSGDRQVGVAALAIGADVDPTTGTFALEPGKPVTVGFRLIDDTVTHLRIVVLDPTTDAHLYRSPADLPVRLGV